MGNIENDKFMHLNNVSFNGEDLQLSPNVEYMIIDCLYVKELRPHTRLYHEEGLASLKKAAFPYNRVPFAIVKSTDKALLKVSNIKEVDYNEIDFEQGIKHLNYFFSTDTGLILIFNLSVFDKIIELFDYDHLLDTLTENYNHKYWKDFNDKFRLGDVFLLSSPGIDSGFEFEGSGTYSIIIESFVKRVIQSALFLLFSELFTIHS